MAEAETEPSLADRRGEIIPDLQELTRTLHVKWRHVTRQQIEEFAITPASYWALAAIGDKGESTVGALAESIGVASSTVTSVLDGLEHHRLVERRRVDSDRRIVRIRLTPKGRELLAIVKDRQQAVLADAVAHMDMSELQGLLQGLKKLLGNLPG